MAAYWKAKAVDFRHLALALRGAMDGDSMSRTGQMAVGNQPLFPILSDAQAAQCTVDEPADAQPSVNLGRKQQSGSDQDVLEPLDVGRDERLRHKVLRKDGAEV